MNMFDRVRAEWENVRLDFNRCEAMQRIVGGDIGIAHYKSILRQIFHQARENPQLQALAAVRFRGGQRESIKRFFQHATSEIGHDKLALADLAVLGEDVANIPAERPHPATAALTAFAFHHVEYSNPIGYLGYLFHLEFTPTQDGALYMDRLRSLGVPDEAMTFLAEHATVDVAHNKLMERYAEDLIRTEDDFDAVVYVMRATGYLYGEMLRAAIAHPTCR
jgi:hypothetical protein